MTKVEPYLTQPRPGSAEGVRAVSHLIADLLTMTTAHAMEEEQFVHPLYKYAKEEGTKWLEDSQKLDEKAKALTAALFSTAAPTEEWDTFTHTAKELFRGLKLDMENETKYFKKLRECVPHAKAAEVLAKVMDPHVQKELGHQAAKAVGAGSTAARHAVAEVLAAGEGAV
jgi:hypothetical protein